MFYVYLLIDPKTNLPFYVGKGKGDRAKVHFRPSNLKQNTLKNNKIKSMLSENVEPIIQIIARNLTEQEAWSLEVSTIKKYGRIDLNSGILCNHTDGGDGPANRKAWNRGKSFSIETRRKMSASRKNSKITKEQMLKNINKMIALNTGRKRPEHSKFLKENNPNKNKVVNESPLLWVNKKTGQQILGTRYDIFNIDPTVRIIELGVAMKGKYAHRGWIPVIFL
jgi:hypothetical protein